MCPPLVAALGVIIAAHSLLLYGPFSQTQLKEDIFTARPKGQRCQVTPYVVNVVVVVRGAIAKYKFMNLLKPS